MKKLEEILKGHPHLSVSQLNALKKAEVFHQISRRNTDGDLTYPFKPGEARATVDALNQALDEAITIWLNAQLSKIEVED